MTVKELIEELEKGNLDQEVLFIVVDEYDGADEVEFTGLGKAEHGFCIVLNQGV